jgi:DNA-3-methyladenine glycosylase
VTRPLERALLATEPATAAIALLGARLVRTDRDGRRVGRIVEVEAYGGPEDRASHARFATGRRAEAMRAALGTAYVYRVYGMHRCLNAVTGPAGLASAVLIRAVERVDGTDAMRLARIRRSLAARRSPPSPADGERIARRIAALPPARLAAGPALVADAFDVDEAETGDDLLDPGGSLRLEAAEPARDRLGGSGIRATRRIGIERAGEPWASAPLRFVLSGSPSLSRRVG